MLLQSTLSSSISSSVVGQQERGGRATVKVDVKKRPLVMSRGRNDSHVGGIVAPPPSRSVSSSTVTTAAANRGSTRKGSSSSRVEGRTAFEKRNSRDKVTAPRLTNTDLTLLSLLDGGGTTNKRKKGYLPTSLTNSTTGRKVTTTTTTTSDIERRNNNIDTTVKRKRPRSVNNDDDDDDKEEVIVVLPRPPPSCYSSSRSSVVMSHPTTTRRTHTIMKDTIMPCSHLHPISSNPTIDNTTATTKKASSTSSSHNDAYPCQEEERDILLLTLSPIRREDCNSTTGNTKSSVSKLPLLGIGGGGGGGGGGMGKKRNGRSGGSRPSLLRSSIGPSSSSSSTCHEYERESNSGSGDLASLSIMNNVDNTMSTTSRMTNYAKSDMVSSIHKGSSSSGSSNKEDTPTMQWHAEWYDPEEFASMEKEASSRTMKRDEFSVDGVNDNSYKAKSGRGGRNRGSGISKTKGNVNDNFVRLDMRNSSGSCRGARNLKKANKHKLWRAQHRFGMNDTTGGSTNDDDDDVDDGVRGSMYQQQRQENYNKYASTKGKKADYAGGGDLKCFASTKNAGVDPLDDFVDGVYDTIHDGGNKKTKKSSTSSSSMTTRQRDESVPLCTRHQRSCKLLTVKRNNKGNKGRKFYVCCMPKGEQCDYFKWEEDTLEATQRALLESSTSSGFIARQVAAAKLRFKELTVPELRILAKERGIKAVGKKNEILTRLLIWVRDQIANSVDEPDTRLDQGGSCVGLKTIADAAIDDDGADDNNIDGKNENTDAIDETKKQLIELSDDESSSDDSSDDYDSDDCELELCHVVPSPIRSKCPTVQLPSTLHESLENYFGYTEFRDGQEWAIRRVLAHQRTLLVAPTGQGKSLCYALPAAISDGICLVVSPLISLMQDQLRQLPPKIPAATLSGSMTIAQMALIVDDVMRGRYKVLFVSPERLASAAFRRLVRPKFNMDTRQYERQFPVVSLLCVDEAHCLSQWGHNFRPSYLRIRSLLPLIDPKSILALTATAGPMVICDICNTLCIPYDGTNRDVGGCSSSPSQLNDDGVKVLNCDRDNIDVFSLVLQSNDERRYLLHKILKEKTKEINDDAKKLPIDEGCLSKGSVIIYVWRQKDTEIVAEQLNGAGIRGGIVCYHGGMDSNSRSRAQSKFLRGKARICVATVAFGLGINKPDIEGVIHLCLPPSPEHYLQEIGRAGRDGRPAIAIALPLLEELVTRHSLAHSDRLSNSQLSVIFRSLQKLVNEALIDIPPEAGVDLDASELFIDDIHVAMPVAQTVDASDCKEEWIETIFSLLEGETLSNSSLLSVEGYLPDVATITLKKRSLDKLEQLDPMAKSIAKCGSRVDELSNVGGTAMEKGFYAYSFGTYTFSVVRCARCMGPQIEPRHVYAALRRMQNSGELELVLETKANGRALHLRMTRAGLNLFHKVKGGTDTICNSKKESTNDIGEDLEEIVVKLSTQFATKEIVTVGKVESMYEIIHHVSCAQNLSEEEDMSDVDDDDDDDSSNNKGHAKKSSRLVIFQEMVQQYFRNVPFEESASNTSKAVEAIKDFPLHNSHLVSCLTSDISLLMQMLVLRRQEQLSMAVHINNPVFTDYRDLCIAKILHAIDSPRAPILQWYSHVLWGKYRGYSFSSVVQAVKKTFDT